MENMPAISVNMKAMTGFISEKPQLIPVAIESNELASASAAASATERILELSKSAIVSSR